MRSWTKSSACDNFICSLMFPITTFIPVSSHVVPQARRDSKVIYQEVFCVLVAFSRDTDFI